MRNSGIINTDTGFNHKPKCCDIF